MHWNELTELEQLEAIINQSEEQPVLIFKHSTRCSISRFALKQFENEFDLQDKIAPYYLDLFNHRDISNEIAFQFKVQHQSPQLLLLKKRVVVYHTSHENIDATELKKYL
ncbi:bacillithiol system redox-active protein YtxJ [Flavobacterium sp.]|jgi:bacillithiol system protein YtxJ|uniref:bacillithiol system redox-active protein YtxJ n=1 Tax=Flavobacterium sp. TaxID=239 RepID=UPI0037C141AB